MVANMIKSLTLGLSLALVQGAVADPLQAVVSAEHRTEANVIRDGARHPAETLAFFGVKATDTLAEITPGGGWYTELLAPLVRDQGLLYAVHFPADSEVAYYQRSRKGFLEKLAATPAVYDKVKVTEFVPQAPQRMAPLGQVDKVLTFRNVHNWLKGDSAEQAFKAFHQLLKPGGVLGVVEHRAKPGTSLEAMQASGYVTEAEVIRLAEAAGFVLDGKSEINANNKDSADHPKGVWSLPPSLALGEQDREKYLAIGESDRMTLRFRKPE